MYQYSSKKVGTLTFAGISKAFKTEQEVKSFESFFARLLPALYKHHRFPFKNKLTVDVVADPKTNTICIVSETCTFVEFKNIPLIIFNIPSHGLAFRQNLLDCFDIKKLFETLINQWPNVYQSLGTPENARKTIFETSENEFQKQFQSIFAMCQETWKAGVRVSF
jgi:hypothetical protein